MTQFVIALLVSSSSQYVIATSYTAFLQASTSYSSAVTPVATLSNLKPLYQKQLFVPNTLWHLRDENLYTFDTLIN